MFSPLGTRGGTKKPPRSMGLLLFLCVMLVLATLLLVRDLQTGPNPLWAYKEVLAPPPRATGEPVEVLFLDEETEAELRGAEPDAPAVPDAPDVEASGGDEPADR